MKHVDGVAVLDHMRGSSEDVVELSARRCYKSFDVGLNLNVTKVRQNSADYHRNILQSGHGSVLAHCWATFAFEDISRVMTHELCRNMIGIKDTDAQDDLAVADFGLSQESLRYVRLDQLRVWLPPEFDDDEFARGKVIEAIEYLESMQKLLAAHYRMDDMPFERKKKLTSALRRILPMGIGTGIVWTVNFRALRWVIEQRTSRHAEAEIRLAFNPVAKMATETWPLLFGDFKPVDTGDGPGMMEWVPEFHKV
jgi:thymidylate synthase (FAD)